MITLWKYVLAVTLVVNTAVAVAQQQDLALKSCHLDGIKQALQCGTLQVPENYQKPDGRKITINFALLPAIDANQHKAPLMFLAGGPGQAAVELAAGLYRAFNEVRKTHDIILIDQRGTGKSHAIDCDANGDRDPYVELPEDFSEQEIKDCIDSFDGDLSQYNSENAIRDFDAVRDALGYDKIHLYGGSYGTRAGLVYMRMFPQSLLTVVLDSVGPIEVPIGLFGQSAARSFDMVLAHCQQEQACHQAYPNLRQEFDQVMARLNQGPIDMTITHPRLGSKTEYKVSRNKFISTLRMQLYSPKTQELVPLIIHQASLNNFAPLAGLTAQMDKGKSAASGQLYIGLTFNILCNEDIPRISEQMFSADADNDFGGSDSHLAFKKACPLWPQYRPAPEFYQPVMADIPTLIISGDMDPVTPPSNGEYAHKTLPNSKHLVLKNSAHTPGATTCAIDIISEFLDKQDPNKLDESCLGDIPQLSFMTGLNGGI